MAQSLEIGPGFETMPVGAVVGIPPDRDVDDLRRQVDASVSGGISRLRMKIEPGWVVTPVAAIRADHEELVIQVDANGSFDMSKDDVDALGRLADFDVLCVEQPLPPADLIAHAELAKRLPLPICLDESLTTPRRVQDALRNGACAMACLKPGRLGGLRATRAAHVRVPRSRGFPPSWAGSSRPASGARRTSPWRRGWPRTRRAWSVTWAIPPTTWP